MVQKIYSKMHPVSCTNTHHDVTDLLNCEITKTTKTWISWEWNITFLRNEKQRNYCVSLLRKTKKYYYSSSNVKDIVDNKQFLRPVKPLFSDKTKWNEKITLVEDEAVTTQWRKCGAF